MSSSEIKLNDNHYSDLEQKNIKLEKLVTKISAELDLKNRELDIETALEKVRSIALVMNKTNDMLDVCRTISNQLQRLGVTNIRNVQTVIVNKSKGIYHNYQFFTAYGESIVEDTDYKKHPTVLQMVLEMERSPDAYFNGSFKGKELDVFREYRKDDYQFPDPLLDKSTSLHYYFYSIGQGGLGLTTYHELHQDNLEIFKRFHKVFSLAYRRFLDIKRAEAQAREAQIEAALERVRAKAMGMHQSEEVGAVSDILFAELNNLDFDIRGCSIVVIDEPEDKMELWRARSNVAVKPFESTSLSKATDILKKYTPDFFPKFMDAVGTRNGQVIEEFSGKRRLQFLNAVTEQYNYSNSEKALLEKNTPDTITTHFLFFKLGYLVLLSEKRLSEKDLSIAERFIDVFSFAYSRFLDIKKAEAQVREAQIQLALERVRARTMAMQHSDELAETSFLLAQQVRELGINAWGCAFHIYADDDQGDYEWFSNKDGYLPFYKTPRKNFFKRFYEKRRSGESLYVEEFKGKVCEKHYEYLLTLPVVGDALQELRDSGIPLPTSQIDHVAYFKHGYLLFITYEHIPEAYDIFKRFAKEFEQTYTRFLDLQKSEAQAREAQIEAALERIRTQAMAMQHSDDLIKSTSILFEELAKLELPLGRCGIGIFDRETRDCELYTTAVNNKGQAELVRGVTSLTVHPMLIKTFECWEVQESLQYILEGKELEDYYKLVSKSAFHLPKDVLSKSASLPKEYYLYTPFGAGGLYVFSDTAPSDELIKVIRRFAQVFHMTYTRYEDLQNAEEQAREAHIEAALERVRAKTMSMHKSEDLTSAVDSVFSELDNLGFKTVRCGIGIFNDHSRKVNVWTASSGKESKTALLAGDEFLEGHPLLEKIYDGWQNQYDFSYTLTGKELIDYYKYTKSSNLPVKAPESLSEQLTQYFHCVMFPAGGLFAFRDKVFSDEGRKLMKRFADVFHLAFTRHLDLKQAEEQNKIIQAENARKSQELEEARQLQLSMLPKDLPRLSHLDIAVYMQTATEVGGDYYDFNVNSNGALTAVVGDATGHGLKAGMMVTATKSLFESLAAAMEPAAFLRRANHTIKQMQLGTLKMALAMLRIDGRSLSLSSAGMPPIVVYRQASNTLEEIVFEGMPLGSLANFPYEEKQVELLPGDRIIIMSDGFPERRNAAGEMLEYRAAYKAILAAAPGSPQETVEQLVAVGDQWANGRPQDDDVTFVVLGMK